MGTDSFTAAMHQAQASLQRLAAYIGQAPGVINPGAQPALLDTYNQGSFSGGAGVLLLLGLVVIGLLVLK